MKAPIEEPASSGVTEVQYEHGIPTTWTCTNSGSTVKYPWSVERCEACRTPRPQLTVVPASSIEEPDQTDIRFAGPPAVSPSKDGIRIVYRDAPAPSIDELQVYHIVCEDGIRRELVRKDEVAANYIPKPAATSSIEDFVRWYNSQVTNPTITFEQLTQYYESHPETQLPPAASVSVDEWMKSLGYVYHIDVLGHYWEKGNFRDKDYIKVSDNAAKAMHEAFLAQPPDHSGYLKREEVEAALEDEEIPSNVEHPHHEQMVAAAEDRNECRQEIRQKLGLSGSQEKEK